MTATDGGPALPGVDAPIRARDERGAGVSAAHAPRLRTVLAVGRGDAPAVVARLGGGVRTRERGSPVGGSHRAPAAWDSSR